MNYNIAVCHFKLRDFDEARRGFQAIADEFPLMRGFAEYNLGLIMDLLYTGIAGTRQRIDLRYRWYSGGHRLQARYWLETIDREDPGVSAERKRFGFEYRYRPDRGWGYEAGFDPATATSRISRFRGMRICSTPASD